LIYSNDGFIIWDSEKNGVIVFEEYDGDARELFSNSRVVEWDSEEEIIGEEVSEKEVEDSVESNTTSNSSLEWKGAYLDYLYKNGNAAYGYSLDYIDGDDIPELVINTYIAAYGTYLCTYKDGNIIETPVGEYLTYILQENSFCVSGGRMGCYHDVIYEIVDGIPQEVASGEYIESEYVEYDEYGDPIFQYTYYWNEELVSQDRYLACIEDYVSGWWAGHGDLYEVIDVLEHPLDITIIDSYTHTEGYFSDLNQYVILFDGIEGDILHFTVRYNDEVVTSLSATIIDTKTAIYKNDKSSLKVKFNEGYQKFEIEGYIDTIDLTSTYWGMWR
jgi:hypothetical protein